MERLLLDSSFVLPDKVLFVSGRQAWILKRDPSFPLVSQETYEACIFSFSSVLRVADGLHGNSSQE